MPTYAITRSPFRTIPLVLILRKYNLWHSAGFWQLDLIVRIDQARASTFAVQEFKPCGSIPRVGKQLMLHVGGGGTSIPVAGTDTPWTERDRAGFEIPRGDTDVCAGWCKFVQPLLLLRRDQ